MISLSYAQCLNDPTYCDTGKEGGAKLLEVFGVKPAQPRPLADILPHVTVSEALWCLRAVKISLRREADDVAWEFIQGCLEQLPMFNEWTEGKEYFAYKAGSGGKPTTKRLHLLDAAHWHATNARTPKEWRAWQAIIAGLEAHEQPSQLAVNVSAALIKAKRFDKDGAAIEEQRQRDHLTRIL